MLHNRPQRPESVVDTIFVAHCAVEQARETK
jgi:hypothetical protein